MAKVRVSTLAKEFGMTSKEMLGHLAEMKIPAKGASSALEDAYVSMVRKKLAPILEARAAEIEAEKRAEEEAAAEEAKRAAEEAERERIAAEARREEERKISEAARAAEEAARAAAAEAERIAREKAEAERREAELEAKRRAVPASDSGSRFRSLLDQIAAQEEVLKEKKQESAKKEEAREDRRGNRDNNRRGGRRAPQKSEDAPARSSRRSSTPSMPAGMDFPNPDKQGKGKKQHKGHAAGEEDRYSRMAREAEEYSREKVLEEARAAVEEASRESTGRRKKRKEKREREAARVQEEKKIEEALAQGINPEELDAVRVSQGVTVAELAEALEVPANDIIKRLFLLGTPLTMTQTMSDDLVELVADDLGRQVKIITPEEENTFSFYDDPADLKSRAPVVTVMGHVDHGKTSLLDAIRNTGVAAGEAGGITQAIGASQVFINGRKITFIDTPGHATFTAMRARGAKVTDIVILIVAADDGVMPQTIESINHAKAAGVPIVVAVNKIDKPGANPDKVRQELTEYGIIPEEWGGQNMFVNISAKKKIGIDELLETVILQADVLELKANPDTFASGNVLEAKLDKGRGSVATVLVTRGTLHVGDTLVAGLTYGRVRAMLDPKGRPVTEAGPSDAVEILGLQSVPNAGDEFRVFEDEREARALAEQRSLKARIEEQSHVKHVTLENLFDTMADAEVKELNLIIKADVQGSIEALKDSLDKMDQSEVRINTIHAAVGAINETDVVLADASNAIIIGFGVRPDGKARSAAEHQGVEIRCYDVIYKALEDLDAARIGMLKPTEVEVSTGLATVVDTFKVPKVGIAAGVRVEEGEIAATDSVRLVRDGIVVFNGKIASMRHYKDEAKSLRSGTEGGIGLENFQDIKPGDQIEGYRIDQVARTE
ncbi:translation initiation factor IF-2 [Collinsella bouchesdurhonensis]|uniref:translation initiation factor IF-2 n=1 Tax=Collinsella bouchesdurhonensis TaxID=1907654 RepID=UPI002E9D4D15|nr:translation initiation factor IF-2 [Collinsella bouchesdurhonensis]MEE0278769.1 translation initiation factor IF-2 [Collinsella bouchesdurhonensis]